MTLPRTILLAAAILLLSARATSSPAVEEAAKRFYASVKWQGLSVVEGNFSCSGRKEQAILGTSETEIIVAVFIRGLSQKPELLRFSAMARSAESAVLTTEDLDFKIAEFEREVGNVPPGLRPSKSCLGLNMSDQLIDSAHIYWSRKARRFESWSR